MEPEIVSSNPMDNLAIVDLPLPLWPNKTVYFPFFIVRLKFSKIGESL